MNAVTQAVKSALKAKEEAVESTPAVKKYPLYAVLALRMQAYINRMASTSNPELKQHWLDVHADRISELVKEWLPSGGGFDAGTKMQLTESTAERLVFTTAFHHLSNHGYYDGWTEHKVIIKASLAHGFDIQVSGRNRNDIKDYIAETFMQALRVEVPY